jgi:UDP-N-acetyl-D-glucosamine 4,6-dehydratase
MGEPVQIRTLAETMIRLYASRPVEIVYTGLRPGEKLYEELLIDESEQKTAFESILIARPTRYPINALVCDIDALAHTDNVVEGLKKIVPEFEHAKHN